MPGAITFPTEPQLALPTIERVVQGQVPFEWAAIDSMHGVGEIELAPRRAYEGHLLSVTGRRRFQLRDANRGGRASCIGVDIRSSHANSASMLAERINQAVIALRAAGHRIEVVPGSDRLYRIDGRDAVSGPLVLAFAIRFGLVPPSGPSKTS